MTQHEEFDLDVNEVEKQQPQTRGVGTLVSIVASEVVSSVVTGCTGNCLTVHCDITQITKRTTCTQKGHQRC